MLRGISAFAVEKPRVYFKIDKSQQISLPPINAEFKTLEKAIVVNNHDEVINFEFEISDNIPQQVSFLVGSIDNSVESSINPSIEKQSNKNVYKFQIDVLSLSKMLLYFALKEKQNLSVSLILASEGATSENIFIKLFELTLDFEIKEKLELPPRLGPLPNVYHIFKANPKTISKIYALFCSSIIIALGFMVLIKMEKSIKLPNGLAAIHFFGLLGSIIGTEFIFVKYYLGASIFTTLNHAFYSLTIMIYCGSRVLSYLSQKEQIQKKNS